MGNPGVLVIANDFIIPAATVNWITDLADLRSISPVIQKRLLGPLL